MAHFRVEGEIDKSADEREDRQNHERNLYLVSRSFSHVATSPHQRRREK